MGKVLGSRVLIKTVAPRTEMDRVEQQGLVFIPKWVKKENSPMPTTGIVLAVGSDVQCAICGEGGLSGNHRDDLAYCASYTPIINEGDMVMFPKFSGSDFQIENEDLRIVDSKEILCTLVDTQQALVEVEDGEEASLG